MLAPPRPLQNVRRSSTMLAMMIGVAIVAAAALVTVHQVLDRSTTGTTWSDDFNGPAGSAANQSIWRPSVGGDGWGNNELECYTGSRNNSALDGHGHLVITARYALGHHCADGRVNNYTSARLRTETLKTMLYGHVRVRAEMPTGTGAWPAIWALGNDHSTVGWPESGELDIAEVVGNEPTIVHTSIHGPDPQGNPFDMTAAHDVPALPAYQWHVFGLDWTPTKLAFSMDGHTTFTATKAEVEMQGKWVFDKPFYLLLDVAVGGNFPGPPTTPDVYPQRLTVDYVHVFA